MAEQIGISKKYGRSRRKSLLTSFREAVWAKTNGFCWYCGEELTSLSGMHAEHQIPVSKGGGNSLENLVPACSHCNFDKRNASLDEFRFKIADRQASEMEDTAFWFGSMACSEEEDPRRYEDVLSYMRELASQMRSEGIRFYGEGRMARHGDEYQI